MEVNVKFSFVMIFLVNHTMIQNNRMLLEGFPYSEICYLNGEEISLGAEMVICIINGSVGSITP